MKKIIGVFLLLTVFAGGLLGYSLHQYDIEEVIICSVNDDSHHIPAEVCGYYLQNYRVNEKDVAFLQGRAGLGFLVNLEDVSKRDQLIGLLISKGLDVNGVSNIDGLTPLHAAILLNDAGLVSLLLKNKADPMIQDRDNKLNARDFLKLLVSNNPGIDRQAVAQLLG